MRLSQSIHGRQVLHGQRSQRGQALVEFAVCSIFLLLLLAGAIDFGTAYAERLEVANAARVGARWGSLHSGDPHNSWTNNATPAENTIQGQVIYAGDTRNIVNDNTHIVVKYYIWTPGTTTTTYCGWYDPSADLGTPGHDGFTAAPSTTYTESQCVAVDNIIQVVVRYDYQVLTPAFAASFQATVPIKSQASFVIQS